MVLFKAPDVPEKIVDIVPQGVEVHELNSSGREYSAAEAEMSCIVCSWEFFQNRRDLISGCSPAEESIIILYPPGQSEEIQNHSLIYQFVPIDRFDILRRTLRNLFKSFIRHAAYEKEKTLNRELLSIGIALSAERDNDKLLDDILFKIRRITKADAGSLYLLESGKDPAEKSLLFKIAQNDSNPSDFSEFRMSLNTKSIAGYVAVTSEILNIPDAYAIPESEHYSFNKSYDLDTNYRSCSMLAVPMVDHLENIIGVIQLINKKLRNDKLLQTPEDFKQWVEPFNNEDEKIVLALASQAAVSLENNILYNEIEALFEGLVAASVKAIESRDPTTSGHSSRVAAYSVKTAEVISSQKKGPFKDVEFSSDKLKELRYSGLLHDFGKVGVRESVLVKSKKLYPGRIELIKQRFDYIRKCIELEAVENGSALDLSAELNELDTAAELIEKANEPTIFSEESADRLKYYNQQEYTAADGTVKKWLTDEELEYLSIKKGSLTESERKEIESHVEHSYEFLKNIPWTASLKNLPAIARGHHERPDGTGYPDGAAGDVLSLQSRIMAVADVYDALTAGDRPYKKALNSETARKILSEEAVNGHLDPNVVEIFIKNKIYEAGDII